MELDLEQPSGEDVVGSHGKAPICTAATIEHEKERTAQSVGECILNTKQQMQTGDNVVMHSSKNLDPHDGMKFDSKEEAFSFYKEYAKSFGFSSIIKSSRRSRISGKFIDAKFVCGRYGSKRVSGVSETLDEISYADGSVPTKKKRGRISRSLPKTDCKACLHVKRMQDGRWIINNFVKEHNHEFYPGYANYFRGQRNMDPGNNNSDALSANLARTKRMQVSMLRRSGGMKKIERQEDAVKNGRGLHLSLEVGEAQAMIEHLMSMKVENPNFFYAIDLKQEQCLKNIFWVDAKSRIDYESFCDVVFFDTTYVKEEYKLSLVPFIGVNHHFQFLLLGCAIIADESKSTFLWVTRAWLRAMGGQAPKVILTDQDNALKDAIADVFPDSRHCFCLWHIMSKVQDKLNYVTQKHVNFTSKFNKCVLKSVTDEQFKMRWRKMVDRFDVGNDSWLQLLYEDRHKWIPTYMRDIFLAGMSTLQRSETTGFLDKCMQRRTTLKEFLEQYKAIVHEKLEEEAKADFETRNKQPWLKSPSPFGKQLATMYTHTIFKKFQVEVLGVVACHPKKESEDGSDATFRVQDFEENHNFLVSWNEKTSYITCSCHLFEYSGFLCRHAMIVLQLSGVHDIPSQYILKRWTKCAKDQEMMTHTNAVEPRIERYNDLRWQAFKLSDEGSLCEESYNFALSVLNEALRKCETLNYSVQSVVGPHSPAQGIQNHEVTIGNSRSKIYKSIVAHRGKMAQEAIADEMNETWEQMEQLDAAVSNLDGYFGAQQIIQGMGQTSTAPPTCAEYYGHQENMQCLENLSSVAPIRDPNYPSQQRLHGVLWHTDT